MKIKANRVSLLAACQAVAPAVAVNTTKEVLKLVKITADAGESGVWLMATDNEIGVRVSAACVGSNRPGECLVQPGKLISILRESDCDTVEIESTSTIKNGPTTTVKTPTGRFVLPVGDPSTFPDVPGFDADNSQEIDAAGLLAAINRVAFAADKTEATARWAVTGILWETEGESVRLTATDTRRIASQAVAVKSSSGVERAKGTTLIPRRAIGILARLLAAGGSVRCDVAGNSASFQCDGSTLTTRLVEGRFPPYRDIIGKAKGPAIELPVGQFLSAVRQASIMTDDETKRVDFTFSDRVTLAARGADSGSGDIEMPLPDYAGQRVAVSLNPQYLLDMLRTIDADSTITIQVQSSEKPVVFRMPDYFYLVMPMNG